MGAERGLKRQDAGYVGHRCRLTNVFRKAASAARKRLGKIFKSFPKLHLGKTEEEVIRKAPRGANNKNNS